MRNEVLRMDRVTQVINGVTTLQNLNLHLFSGEIVGLICANTHGKEELIKLLCHNTPLHYGTVYFREKLVNSYRHSPMTHNSVAIIDKHSRLVEDLTVADNVFVLRRGFKLYRINPDTLDNQLRQFIGDYNTGMTGYTPVSQLSVFEKCLVELMKAVVTGTKLVVVRDISNIVSAADLARFHGLLRHYAAQGMTFLYVCNHHEEAFSICNRAALMENGRILRVLSSENFSDELIWHYCLDFSPKEPPQGTRPQHAVLQLKNVYTDKLRGLSMAVYPGECVVLLDVNNAIFADLVGLLTGELRPCSGSLLLEERSATRRALRRRVSVILESPARSMLFTDLSALDNLCFLGAEKNPRLWMSSGLRQSILREYEPYTGDCIHQQDVRLLSPQEQYNLAYYRIHLYNPSLAVCIQPFYGADMYLRHHIIGLINALRQKHIAVLLLMVNVSDSLTLADRMLVVEKGRLQAEYTRQGFPSLTRRKDYTTPANFLL